MAERIAIIDDDPMSRKVVGDVLGWAGFEVVPFADGRTALAALHERPPAGILLDLWMPELDGLAVCRALRADPRTAGVPILMLTGSSDEEDQVLGFEVGADDYITKPWGVPVLVARLKAVLRRAAPPRDPRTVVRGALVLDGVRLEAHVEGKPLNLTPTEFRILLTLAAEPQRVFTRTDLLPEEDPNALTPHRNVDVHISALRKKLGRHHGLVDTVWGTGYRLGVPPPPR